MISVLIPIYNFDITSFVIDLSNQLQNQKIEYEIRCYDDASREEFKIKNVLINTIKNVIYNELPQNLGRSKIRNILGNDAKGTYLLFVDCDSQILNSDYISNYINQLSDIDVIFGGRAYQKDKPKHKSQILRWKYGSCREVKSVVERKTEPYRNFMTNNFIISKHVFKNLNFDETVVGYGYEDTLFAQTLKKEKIEVKHIDNPLIHIDLESTTEFLEKTKNGIKNLALMIKQNKIDDDIKIARIYCKLRLVKLDLIFELFFWLMSPLVILNLMSNNPSLFFFDCYKLNRLCKEYKKV